MRFHWSDTSQKFSVATGYVCSGERGEQNDADADRNTQEHLPTAS